MAHRLTTCTFCGVGCGLYLETSEGRVVGAYPSFSHPTNQGRICLRGWHVHEIASSPDRLKHPLIRKNGRLEEVGWDEAIAFTARRLHEVREQHGPDALAFLNSPRSSNEEAYLLQKFARAVIGTNNVDHGTGIYCNNSIDVLLEMLGVAASTGSIADVNSSDVIIVDGVDLARRLPTVAGAVIRAKLKGARLIVIGTRRHRVAESADLFLQIKPNTEALLYGAIAKVIVDHGMADLGFIRSQCRRYDEWLATNRQCDLLHAAEGCGVSSELIEAAALAYARAKTASLLFSSSMEERSKDSIRSIVNLTLLTGHIGKRGSIFALTEQNNLQGVCDMGVLPDQLPGYQPVTLPAARLRLGEMWQAELPEWPGASARSVLTDRAGGKIKAMWLGRYDPASTALFTDVSASLRELDFLVVQHLFMTETAKYAHVVLPTTAFGEEQVSFTSTERRIQLAEQAIEPLDGLKPAWQQLTAVARAFGADWRYGSAAEVMEEIAEAVSFYSGVTYENLAREYGRQWPCTKDRPLGTPTLFVNHADGHRFSFVPVESTVPPATTAEFPLMLVFGNSLYYWNQNVLIRHSETLKREYRILSLDYPDGFVELNIDDAKQLGIRDGQKIAIKTAEHAAAATARVTGEVMRGSIFVPYFMRNVEQQILGRNRDGAQSVAVRVEGVRA